MMTIASDVENFEFM